MQRRDGDAHCPVGNGKERRRGPRFVGRAAPPLGLARERTERAEGAG